MNKYAMRSSEKNWREKLTRMAIGKKWRIRLTL